MDISPISYKDKIITGEKIEILKQNREYKANHGEIIKVKVLDYLGGGKLIIDVNGQRMVATSDIVIEKDQEIFVKVINAGEGKIILQLISGDLLTPKLGTTEHENVPLGNAIKSLLILIENYKDSIIVSDKENPLFQIANLLRRIPIKFDTKDNAMIAEQIHESIIMSGYNYEHALAESITKDHAFLTDKKLILKAELLKLLQDDELPTEIIKRTESSVKNILESIEYQQLRSVFNGKIYVDLPIVLGDQETTAELEFFRPKGYKQNEDKNFNISIRFNLETIGYVEFIISMADNNISCQIKANRHDTYVRIKSQLDILGKRFSALGYNIIGIFCSQNTQRVHSLDTRC